MRSWMSVVVVALVASQASGDSPKTKPRKHPAAAKATGTAPAKGFWKVLVQPHAKWVLEQEIDDPDDHASPITVETYDVRKVGSADVARLRWRQGSNDAAIGTSMLQQFAVTPSGLYILSSDMDDAKIAEVLKGKPSRSDPPKPYQGTKLNKGRYLEIRDDLVCMGEGPLPEDPPCEDTCFGEVCISATEGIVRIDGNWAPNMEPYAQKTK